MTYVPSHGAIRLGEAVGVCSSMVWHSKVRHGAVGLGMVGYIAVRYGRLG